MFKTNSRKGLSLAAIVALGASLLVGAPAQAAGEVSLETTSGTTYAALAGTTFQLSLNAGSSIPSGNYAQLKAKITNTGATTYSATLSAPATGATGSGSVNATTSGTVLSYFAASSTNSAGVVSITTADSSSGAVLTVTAWLDADFDDVIDSGEFVSEVRTVTFYKQSAVTWTTALTAPVLAAGNSTLSAVVSSDVGINMAQLSSGAVKVAFATVSGAVYTNLSTTATSSGTFTDGVTASPVTGATTTAKAELGGISISAGATYVAVAIINSVEAGSEVYAVVSTANVSAIETFEITDDNNSTTSTVVSPVIRPGTAVPVEFTAVVSKSAGVKAAAGTLVTVTVTEGTLTSVSAVVGGGKTLSNASTTTSEKITFTVAVDADGAVTVPLAATMATGQTFTVALTADNIASSTITVTATTATAAIPVDITTIGNSVVKIVKGESTTIKAAVLDSFGAPLTGEYRIYATGGSATQSVAVVNGAADVSVTPAATATFTLKLQKMNASTLVYEDVANASFAREVTVGASNAAAAVTLVPSSASFLVLNNKALKAVDTRLGATAPTVVGSGNIATLSGQVTDANGIATYGVVTLAAPNVMFKNGDVYTLGSVTLATNASGAYSGVTVYSNTAGKVTLSATVGAATKAVGLSFNAAADTAGAKWVLTTPAAIVPGSTAQFKAVLLDTWSNPVKVTTTSKISVTYTGPGFVPASLPATTDADGMLSFSVLYGSADAGAVSVTFAYDGDATATTTTDNVASVATATVAAPAAPVAPVAEKKLTVGTFNGYIAIYAKGYEGSKLSAKVAGKWLTVEELTSFQRVVRKTGAGYSIKVDLYIDGVFAQTSTTVTK